MTTANQIRYPLARVNYDEEEIAAVIEVLGEGQTTCGPRVKAFEEGFASYVGSAHATMVNSGSSADLLVALGLGEPDGRDEILISAVTWPTQVWSCLMAGYKVVLVDSDPDTLQMNTSDALSKINRHTKAVFLVHLLGCVGNIDPVLSLNDGHGLSLAILEDCCESLGARWHGRHVGTFGQAAAFSFFFSHLISTMEGGMVVTNSPEQARTHRLLRSHGWEPKKDYRFWFPTWGLNVRPMEVQGAFGNVQLTKIEQFRQARLHNVERLIEQITKRYPDWLSTATVHPECEPSWHGFPIMVAQDAPFSRDDLCKFLDEHGVETRPIVAGNIARQPAMKAHADRITAGSLPGADAIHFRGFYIGVQSSVGETEIDYVGTTFSKFMSRF